jgi:hypothetical protein
VPIVSALVLVLNDHVFKARFGDATTGKLSDAAGLVFIPLLALAVVELLRSSRHRVWAFTVRDLAWAVVLVGVALIAAKVSVTVAHGFGDAGAVVRLPFSRRFDPVTITHDVTDLWTLPALTVAWFDGAATIRRRRFEARRQPGRRTSSSAAQTRATPR